MACLHKHLSSPTTVSLCLDTGDYNCCPNEYQTMIVCGDCGEYKIVSVESVCEECCLGDTHIWDNYLNKWYPANNQDFNLTNYSVYQTALNEAQITPILNFPKFMIKGYHYTKSTDPIRVDSARLYLDTTVNGEECEAIPLFIDHVWAQSTLNYDTQSNNWNNLIIWKNDPTIIFYGLCIVNDTVVYYTLIWNFLENIWYDENMNILSGLDDIKTITYTTWMDTPHMSSIDETSISYVINNLNIDTKNSVSNGVIGNAVSVSYRDPNQSHKIILPETVELNSLNLQETNYIVHFRGIHNFFIKE